MEWQARCAFAVLRFWYTNLDGNGFVEHEPTYAFLSDDVGNLFFHPYIDVATLAADTAPSVPSGMTTGDTLYRLMYANKRQRKKAAKA